MIKRLVDTFVQYYSDGVDAITAMHLAVHHHVPVGLKQYYSDLLQYRLTVAQIL